MSPLSVPGKMVLGNTLSTADPYYNNVSLLLHGDGGNGSTDIIDTSLSPKPYTLFGDAKISTAQSKFGGSSLAFDGSGDYIVYNQSLISSLSTDPFTIEFWVYLNTSKNHAVISYVNSGNNFFIIAITNTGQLDCWFGHNLGGTWGASASTPLSTLNQWYHVAIVRSGNTFTGYVDGISALTLTSSVSLDYDLGIGVHIGRYIYDVGSDLNGYIDDLRITKGVARYTSNFTPPTTPHPDLWT